MDYFFKALIIGFSIAAPVGPIGILCIKRTINGGRISGFISGLGSATADAVYGLIAALGLTAVSSFLISYEKWLSSVGGIFLIYLAIKTILSKPKEDEGLIENTRTLVFDYVSTLALTLTNPITILSFVAIFAGLGLGSQSYSYGAATLTVLGVFCGSALWWLLLCGIVGSIHGRISLKVMNTINTCAGAILFLFGIFLLY